MKSYSLAYAIFRPLSDLILAKHKKQDPNITPRELNHANNDMINVLKRTNIAVLGALAVYGLGLNFNWTLATIGIVCLLSIPSFAIAGGTYAIGWGISNIITSLSTKVIANLGIGLAATLGGWLLLYKHDILPFGLVESNQF